MVIYDGALVSFHKNHHPTFFTHPTGLQIGIYARAARTRGIFGIFQLFRNTEKSKRVGHKTPIPSGVGNNNTQ